MLIVTNNTSTAATNLLLTEFLPTNTIFQGPAGVWTPAGAGSYTHNIATVAPNSSNTTPFSVLIDPATPTSVTAITNVVTLSPGGLNFTLTTPIEHNVPDLYVVKNDNIELLGAATLETIQRVEQKVGQKPWLEAVKQASIQAQALSASPGDIISYTIGYGNAGSGTATNVVITETLPANTSFVGPLYWTQIDATTYVFTITSLAAGSGGALDFRVRIDNPFPGGTPGITNTIQIASDALFECDISDNTSLEFTPVDGTNVPSLNVYLPIIFKNYPPVAPLDPTATLSWLSQLKDKVQEVDGSVAGALTPDGRRDGEFLLTVNTFGENKVVDHVRLVSDQAAGAQWDTIINSVSVLGIFNGIPH